MKPKESVSLFLLGDFQICFDIEQWSNFLDFPIGMPH